MKIILFDLGQTLIENVSINLVDGFVKLFGDALTEEQLKMEIHKAYETFNRRSLEEINIMELLNEITTKYQLNLEGDIEKQFLDAVEVDRLIDDTNLTISKLKSRGYYLGVISNTIFSGRVMLQRLRELGFKNDLAFVLTSADAIYRKPSPLIFQKALTIVQKDCPGVVAGEIYFVGDNYDIDFLGSKQAGLIPIWLNQLNEKKEVDGIVITSLSELVELVDKNIIK